MNNCVVCLSTKAEKCSRIYIQSNEWNKFNIQRIIKKHFWWLHLEQSSTTILKWICRRCWQELSSFHAFYKMVEKLHKECNLLKWPVLSRKNSKKQEGYVKTDVNLQQSLGNENIKMGVDMDIYLGDNLLKPIKMANHHDESNNNLIVINKFNGNENNIQNIVELHIENETVLKKGDAQQQTPHINKIKDNLDIGSGNSFIQPIKFAFYCNDNPNDNTDEGVMVKEKCNAKNVDEFNIKKETFPSGEDGEPLICDDDQDIMEASDSRYNDFYALVKKENDGVDALLAPKDDVQQISDADEVILEINDSMDSTSVDELFKPIKKVDHCDVLAIDNTNEHLTVDQKFTKNDNFTKSSNINLNIIKIKNYMDIDSGNNLIKPIKIASHNDNTDKGVIVNEKFSAKNVDEFNIKKETITSNEDGEPLLCNDDKDIMEASDSAYMDFFAIVKKGNDGTDALLAPKDDLQQISDDDEVSLEINDSMDSTSANELLELIKKVDHCDVLAIDNTNEQLTVVPKFTKNENITKSSNINLNMHIFDEFKKVVKKENYKDHVQATSEDDECTNKVRDYISTVWEDQHLDTNENINYISDSPEHCNEKFLGYTTLIEKTEYEGPTAHNRFELHCRLCNIPMTNFFKLKRHFFLKHKTTKLADHLSVKIDQKYYICTICDKILDHPISYETHLKSHKQSSEKQNKNR